VAAAAAAVEASLSSQIVLASGEAVSRKRRETEGKGKRMVLFALAKMSPISY
jgi:hypothetical protein